MITIGEAYQHLKHTFEALPVRKNRIEEVATDKACGRVLAETVSCRFPSPPFDASAMDGIAFVHDTALQDFRVIGTVAAGDTPNEFTPGPGECVRIMTGAPVPSSTDTVQMVEKVTFEGDHARLSDLPARGSHIRFRGENMAEGAALYEQGTHITAGVLAGLVSNGIRFVKVQAPLRVGVAATGNEVIDFRRPIQPGRIYNSNALTLGAQLASPAVDVIQLGTFPDHLSETVACIGANTDLDVLVLSGGVSMGQFDLVPEAAMQAGFDQVFHKIQMKPGKPLWFGRHASGCMLFGLPGNPVSAMVGALLYVKPMIRALSSGCFHLPCWGEGQLTAPVRNRGRFPFFIGARCRQAQHGFHVEPIQTSGSGDVLRFSLFETLLRLKPETEYNSGEGIQVLLPF